MKVQIVYTSKTGCTAKLAQAIYNGIDAEEKSIHNLADGSPVLDGDVILAGYWGISGGPTDEMKAFLGTVQNKVVGIFCTLGYYADSGHARKTLETGINLVKDKNRIICGFVANGAVAKALIAEQGLAEEHVPTKQKEIRWEIMSSHPTQAECALAAERFRERIHMYCRCKELNIPFESIL